MTKPEVELAPIVRRATARPIPILLLTYVLAFLDRSNLGFAKEQFQAGDRRDRTRAPHLLMTHSQEETIGAG
jgi:hypothetical protein